MRLCGLSKRLNIRPNKIGKLLGDVLKKRQNDPKSFSRRQRRRSPSLNRRLGLSR
jgi:hypothetical protein